MFTGLPNKNGRPEGGYGVLTVMNLRMSLVAYVWAVNKAFRLTSHLSFIYSISTAYNL